MRDDESWPPLTRTRFDNRDARTDAEESEAGYSTSHDGPNTESPTKPNIVFDRTSVHDPTLCAKLIDFDWSGKEGDANVFYPDNLSSSVDWPEGDEPAVSFGKILKKHDLEMAEKWHT